MAPNLNEYYSSQGKTLPTVSERQGLATSAGITGYTGTAEQNSSLLGYLEKTPNQSGNNVITSDNLAPEKAIQVKPTIPDTSSTGMNGSIGSLLETTKANIKVEEDKFKTESTSYAKALKDFGDQGVFNEKIIADQGVDKSKKVRDNFLSQIEQEQKSNLDRVEELRKSYTGTTSGLNEEIGRINRESANRQANYGIGLSASTRNYESASNIAERLINANTDKLKADLESRKFVLQQLGTKLATEKANSFQLQVKQIEREDQYLKEAIKVATEGAKDGTIDGDQAFKAVQDLTSGKTSISQFYNQLGVKNELGNINGYDITSYATDPKHELKVQTIYETMGDVSDEKSATTTIKRLSPSSPITGTMIMNASQQFKVDPKLMIAIMQQDSSLGTAGMGARNNNPGNIAQYDDLADAVEGYPTMQEGVDAVAKWLGGHRSKGIYRGEFSTTLDNVAMSGTLPDKTKRSNLESLKKSIANEDYKSAYLKMTNLVEGLLPTAELKADFSKKRTQVPAIEELRTNLQAYSDAGGDMGLLKGKWEDVVNKVGMVSDPKFKALATDLKLSLQAYRKAMSGAAFSEQESRDYASVNPLASNRLDLNLAIIDGMHDNFKRQLDTTVDTYAGEGAQFIRQYAETGTVPQTQEQAPKQVTPTGNGYVIKQKP